MSEPDWTAHYDDHVPATFEPLCNNGAELFERGIADRHDDPALIYFETAISHRSAARDAHALAVALREELGLEPGERVALMLQNLPQMAIAVHAVWLAGGVVTTVNPPGRAHIHGPGRCA